MVQCADAHHVTFCSRDCDEFPCPVLRNSIAYHWFAPHTPTDLPARQNDALPHSRPASRTSGTGTPQLRIFCLGTFHVYLDDAEIKATAWGKGKGASGKIKALLAYMIFQRTQGARKETIIDVLWPEQTDLKKASHNLHLTLFYLRRALEPGLTAKSQSGYIQYDNNRYIFKPVSPCWIDADAFASEVRRAQIIEQTGNKASAITHWHKAVNLYYGEFLSGLDVRYTSSAFHDWSLPFISFYEQLYIQAEFAIARYYLSLKNYEIAIQHARDLLKHEPTNEEAALMLKQCLRGLLG